MNIFVNFLCLYMYVILVFHCHSACIYVNTYTIDIHTCISTAHLPTCKYWLTDNQPQPTQVREGTSSASPQTPCQGTAAHVWHRTWTCPKWVKDKPENTASTAKVYSCKTSSSHSMYVGLLSFQFY